MAIVLESLDHNINQIVSENQIFAPHEDAIQPQVPLLPCALYPIKCSAKKGAAKKEPHCGSSCPSDCNESGRLVLHREWAERLGELASGREREREREFHTSTTVFLSVPSVHH